MWHKLFQQHDYGEPVSQSRLKSTGSHPAQPSNLAINSNRLAADHSKGQDYNHSVLDSRPIHCDLEHLVQDYSSKSGLEIDEPADGPTASRGIFDYSPYWSSLLKQPLLEIAPTWQKSPEPHLAVEYRHSTSHAGKWKLHLDLCCSKLEYSDGCDQPNWKQNCLEEFHSDRGQKLE